MVGRGEYACVFAVSGYFFVVVAGAYVRACAAVVVNSIVPRIFYRLVAVLGGVFVGGFVLNAGGKWDANRAVRL